MKTLVKGLLLVVFSLLAADFGLAKQKHGDCSKMMSIVGTILYSWWVAAWKLSADQLNSAETISCLSWFCLKLFYKSHQLFLDFSWFLSIFPHFSWKFSNLFPYLELFMTSLLLFHYLNIWFKRFFFNQIDTTILMWNTIFLVTYTTVFWQTGLFVRILYVTTWYFSWFPEKKCSATTHFGLFGDKTPCSNYCCYSIYVPK